MAKSCRDTLSGQFRSCKARRGHRAKLPADMTAGEINKALDRLDRERSHLADAFIAAGRGGERPSETRKKADPLALRHNELADAYLALRMEVERRYGPGAPSRLPRGFGPLGGR